ncbi:phage head-binding domain-containing protein [Pectobacterium parmentieri]|uniref:phage head-binding domain-containing protein n=1 Tax=Pectobacterium parmentieri TaxID=1905730 RepID=UPI001F4155DB|nr:phage head-binding domain-containing protein [Pectobacterium parmentieri]
MAITPNVVISMPSQNFTLARAFKANANGKIYIGEIDSDPTIPSNQIQVYLENEDGSHVPVAQPIVINSAGFPVYNGQIAKFVTVQGHSMAIYDAYNVQQFYFPNVLKYDPDQLRQELSQPGGSELISHKSLPDGAIRKVKEKLDDELSLLDFPNIDNTGSTVSGGFQYAIDYCFDNNKKLFIPSGEYLVNPLTIRLDNHYSKGGQYIRGESRNGVKIKSTSDSSTVFTVDSIYSDSGAEKSCYNLTIECLSIFSGNNGTAIEFIRPTSTVTLNDIKTEGMDGIVVHENFWINSVTNCLFSSTRDGFIMKSRGTTNRFDRIFVFGSTNVAYRLSGDYSSIGALAADDCTGIRYQFHLYEGHVGSLGCENLFYPASGLVIDVDRSRVEISTITSSISSAANSACDLFNLNSSNVTVCNINLSSISGGEITPGVMYRGGSVDSQLSIGNISSNYNFSPSPESGLNIRIGWALGNEISYRNIGFASSGYIGSMSTSGLISPDLSSHGKSVLKRINIDSYGTPVAGGMNGERDFNFSGAPNRGDLFLENDPQRHGVSGYIIKAAGAYLGASDVTAIPIVNAVNFSGLPTNPSVGCQAYHVGIGMPVWWNGANWRDAMGKVISS